MAERPAFRNALRRRRCLVLADGFYEWQRVGRAKRPMRVVMRSGEPFAFAGLWERWRNSDGQVIPSCTIITTEANDLLRPIHARMPVILPRGQEGLWLDGNVNPNPPKDTDGRREDSGRGVRELQARLSGLDSGRREVAGRPAGALGGADGGLRWARGAR